MLKIYNSLTRTKVTFEPLNPPHIGMYVCGPTVYDEPHIGHARSAYIFDVVRRYLAYRGYKVKFVRNVTDVDDKIIEKARKELGAGSLGLGVKEKVKEVSKKYLAAYHEDMEILGIGKPDKEPKATEYIPKMIKFIEDLIKKGCAYEADGDVYFDIKTAKEYGKLSNQNLEKMESGARITPGENKKDPLDFALWKKSKADEPSWDSPWGKGRPGWHIECSVMSSDILGGEFDIHGGGIDLIFPHHENEIAQSEGAGKPFAHLWMHNGLLTINGEKMAKSAGNYITIKDFIKKYNDPNYLKLLFLNTHYRHPVDYSEEKIGEMKRSFERFRILFNKIDRKFGTRKPEKLPTGSTGNIDKLRQDFEAAMDDDFNTPLALGVLFNMVSGCNKILDDEKDDRIFMLKDAMEKITMLGDVFGLSFENIAKEKSDTWVTIAIALREEFRKNKKYKEADEVRKSLEDKGIILEDTKDGTTWRRKC